MIAEKPSVALAIASALGVNEKKRGSYEGSGYIISWCVGHLIELAMPESYNPNYQRWAKSDLPIVPQQWKYEVRASAKEQYNVLLKLLQRTEIDEVICATDAGREGELIFRLVYHQSQCQKPFKRLWISSLEEETIRKGFSELKDGKEYDNLYYAALCRAQADWLVGINATRLFSVLYGHTLNVGRVVTPTLSMIVEKQEEVARFVPQPFYTVEIETNNGMLVRSDRYHRKCEAEEVAERCRGNELIVSSCVSIGHAERAPNLYDLTTLQKEANAFFGFTAQQTLDAAQMLYEKKLITYPRTDSRFVTDDMETLIEPLVQSVLNVVPELQNMEVSITAKQVVDSSKVSDHHAILPTNVVTEVDFANLSKAETELLQLIIMHTLCSVGDAHLYDTTEAIMTCNNTSFSAKGKTIVRSGWRDILTAFKNNHGTRNTQDDEDEDKPIPEIDRGEVLRCKNVVVKEGKTKAPKLYTEASLLSAMEKAGTVKTGDRKGLGTPATRAGIIEKLISTGLVERVKQAKREYLKPTKKGISLIAVMPQIIRSPDLTAEWEYRLKRIEYGEVKPDVFMRDITRFVSEMVSSVERVNNANDLFPSGYESIGECPRCGEAILDKSSGYFCSNQQCRFGVWKDNRYFVKKNKILTADMMRAFLKNGRLFCSDILSGKTGKRFSATIVMDDDGTKPPTFHMEF